MSRRTSCVIIQAILPVFLHPISDHDNAENTDLVSGNKSIIACTIMFYYYSYIILTKNVLFSSKTSYFHSYSPYTALAINGTLP